MKSLKKENDNNKKINYNGNSRLVIQFIAYVPVSWSLQTPLSNFVFGTLWRYVGSFGQLHMSKREIVPFPICRVGFYIFLSQFLSSLILSTLSVGDNNQRINIICIYNFFL